MKKQLVVVENGPPRYIMVGKYMMQVGGWLNPTVTPNELEVLAERLNEQIAIYIERGE